MTTETTHETSGQPTIVVPLGDLLDGDVFVEESGRIFTVIGRSDELLRVIDGAYLDDLTRSSDDWDEDSEPIELDDYCSIELADYDRKRVPRIFAG